MKNSEFRNLSSFQRWALSTTAATYLLILAGGLVRASGAGLGCPDWPRCFGSWIPPASAAVLPPGFDASQFNPALMWTEYSNRLLGVTVGLLILATTISAWRHHRREPRILWASAAALVLTGYQGWLGGRVVAAELAAWIVTLHMLVALVIVSLLLYATVYSFYAPVQARRPAGPQALALWTIVGLIAITLAQVAIGTQVRGRVDQALAAGIARDAALQTAGSIDYLHRDSALAVAGAAVVLMVVMRVRRSSARAAARWVYGVAGLTVVQLALGASMAYVALVPAIQVAHLTVASLLLGAQTVVLLLLRWHR